MPILYIIYTEIVFVGAIGGVNVGLRLDGNGLNGGNGSRGGRGGDGGNGARGNDGSNTLGFCTDGPGVGAIGGNAGSGGKGGRAGKGGNGLNVTFLGPVSKSSLFEINQSGGKQGQPGPARYDGLPGKKGTFGTKPSACPTCPMVTASSWHDGILVENPFKSEGETNIDGIQGLNQFSDDYSPLAIYDANAALRDLIDGKYISPNELAKTDGFKKLLPFDFEDVRIGLEELSGHSSSTQFKTYGQFTGQLQQIILSHNKQRLN